MQKRLFGILLGCMIAGVSAPFGNSVLAEASAQPSQKDFDALLKNGTSKYSQGKQELLIRHFFRDRRDGFFVDIGCYVPRRDSTTYYLEEELHWRGIAVDAQEIYGPAWRKYRPRSKFFAYAVTERSGETITFFAAGPISSLERSNIEAWEKQLKRKLDPEELIVPTITISDLLDREGVKNIDFLSIDINGTEPSAMKGFDIKRFRPELVHIEVHERNREVPRAYFEKNGYRRIDEYLKYDITNWYFTPKESAPATKGDVTPKKGRATAK